MSDQKEEQAETPTCECCGQPLPPKKAKTFRVTHKLETPGLPPLFCLRARDAEEEAERRVDRGLRSHCYVMDARGEWGYWRSWGDEPEVRR